MAENSFTKTMGCVLYLDNIESELQINYWKEEKAEEYGYRPNQIDMIRLLRTDNDDAILLYSIDFSYCTYQDLIEFLEMNYSLEQYLTIELPSELKLEEHQVYLNDFFQGYLLVGDFDEPIHGDLPYESWYYPGGIAVSHRKDNDNLHFEDGKIVHAGVGMNHSVPVGDLEQIDGCESEAVLQEYNFDLFTVTEADEYEKIHDVTLSAAELTSNYWYIFMGKEEADNYYVLFLNERYFTKQDVIDMARSVHFTAEAFIE